MTENYLPEPRTTLFASLDDTPGDTHLPIPRLDSLGSMGLATGSRAYLLADHIDQAETRAEHLSGDEQRAARTRIIGMLEVYNFMVRVVVGSESDPRHKDVYEHAIAQVRADLDESRAFWDHGAAPLERYHRLTKVQQRYPAATGLARQRADALAEEYRTGTDHEGRRWSVRTLAQETGISAPRVQQLLKVRSPDAGGALPASE